MGTAATILVADDQARIRAALARLLSARGYRVLEAADGLQALATIRHERPDVAVLDLVMPHMDGMGVCRALRSDTTSPYVPILFHSQRSGTGDVVGALRAGGDDFVAKGQPDDEIVARVEALVRIRRLLDDQRKGGTTAPPAPARVPDPAMTIELLRELFARSAARSEPLSLLLVSPAHGRIADSQVTTAVSAALRREDALGQAGDGRWMAIMPGTHFGGAMALAERVWRGLRPGPGCAGVSIGVACYPTPQAESADDLLALANAALERAQSQGEAHICLVHHQAYVFRPE